MSRRLLLRCLLLASLATAVIGQDEDGPYFALNSGATFGTNGKPAISLTAWNVDSLEFRVYHVNDPVAFFQQIESPHEFGLRTPRPPHQRTLLERIHGWKHEIRTSIRRSLRAQFTEPPSEHFSSLLKRAPPAAARGTHYAEAPLLNPQQLVLTFTQPVQSKTRWDSTSVPIDIHQAGVYLVEAVRGDLRAYTILMVSDVVLITKTGAGRIVSFVADRNSGEPVQGAEIVTMLRDGPKTSVNTNAAGIAESKIPDVHAEDVRVLARQGANIAVDTLSSYSFEASTERWMGYVYTDRPVYRPGHTVHFRAILRTRSSAGYDVPAAKPVSVEIQDPEQKVVFSKKLTTNAYGTIHDEFELPAGAALGNYFMELHAGADAQMSGNFQVEEYKKPEYEVRVTPVNARVLQGGTVQAVIDAHYYFGEPVANAKVSYAVYRNRYWYPLWYDADEQDLAVPAGDDNDYGEEQILDQEGQLDGEGKLSISFPSAISDHKIDYRYRIEARVTDEARREISGRGSVLATYGSFVVNVTPDRYFYPAGARGSFEAQARDYDNKPVRTKTHLEIRQWRWKDQSYGDVLASADAATGEDGTAKIETPIPQAGSYRVRVTARTPEGRDVEQYCYFWVPGGTTAATDGPAGRTVQIVPDKKTYAVGETAKIMMITGRPNTPVYVTIEGRDLASYQVLRSQDVTVQFEVPVTIRQEPGFYLSAAFLRDGNLYQSSKYIKVPPVDHQLNVAIETDKTQYQPGKSGVYKIRATGGDGRPVARAEFSLGVVDEAIYAIRRDMMEDPLTYFFGHEWNEVYSGNSMSYYFNGEAGKRRMRLAALRPASRLAQLKPERLVQPKIRKAFPDTAFWAADVTTDSSGLAQTKVDFPDSLTTWRATARGVTADTKVGGATLKTIVRKNLILRLSMPRFLVQGDEVVISALVHNYLTSAKKARVSLDVKGLDVLEGATRDVDIPVRGEVRLDWRVRAQQVRSATITGKALTDEESDAMQMDLPVNVPGVKLSTARGSSMAAGAAAAFDLSFPGNVAAGSRSLAIQVSPSIAGSLFGALEYLTSFPYGCVEQTMSSFLPNVVVSQAVRDLGLKVDLDQAALQEKIRAGLERLYGFQHPDGGWGWWETDESHPFMSAYVIAGLSQAQAAGVTVNAEAIQKGAGWVLNSFQKDPRLAFDLRAYMVYSLAAASRTDAPALNQVYEQRTKLSPYGLALLGLALEINQDARAADIAGLLESAAQQDSEQVWWPVTRDQLLDFNSDATPEATAYAVKFLSHQKPGSPLLPKAALWLMNNRDEGYWWSSTKQTAMVIYGLTDYLKATNELKPNLTFTVFLNERPVLTRHLDQTNGIVNPSIVLDESKLDPSVNHVRVTTSGQGRLYYSARAEYYSTENKLQKTGSAALNLLRDYFRLAPAQENGRIVYDAVPLDRPAAAGDILAVRLTVSGAEWKYLMLEDPIPAGTEFIERDSNYELRKRPPWWEWWFTRRELHDDRMAIFQTWFPAGQHEYFYLLKVVNPGVFQVSPARVQPMYKPGVLSTTEARRLEVK